MSHTERRQHTRHPVSYAVKVSSLTEDGSLITSTGNLQDISDSGISFLSHDAEAFQLNQKIDISILAQTGADEELSLNANGEVLWIEHSEYKFNQALIGVLLEELIQAESIASGSE